MDPSSLVTSFVNNFNLLNIYKTQLQLHNVSCDGTVDLEDLCCVFATMSHDKYRRDTYRF